MGSGPLLRTKERTRSNASATVHRARWTVGFEGAKERTRLSCLENFPSSDKFNTSCVEFGGPQSTNLMDRMATVFENLSFDRIKKKQKERYFEILELVLDLLQTGPLRDLSGIYCKCVYFNIHYSFLCL